MEEREPPGFSTPSERSGDLLRRFVLLGRVDGLRLARIVWWMALALFVLQFALTVAEIPIYLSGARQIVEGWVNAVLLSQLLLRVVTPLLWLLLVRLVIEVCLRLLVATELR